MKLTQPDHQPEYTIAPGFYTQPGKKRVRSSTENLFHLSTSNIVPQSNPTKKIEKLIELGIALQDQEILTIKPFSDVVIIGQQSSGKSSFFNSLTSCITGRDIELAPSHKQMCTTRPLKVNFYDRGEEQKDFVLRFPDSNETFTEASADDVREKLSVLYKGYSKNVSVNAKDALQVSIKCKTAFSCMDTPGPTTQSDMTANANYWDKYFDTITESSQPLILITVNGAYQAADLKADLLVLSMGHAIASRPKKWKDLTVFIVATHADDIVRKSHENAWIKSCSELASCFVGIKKVIFGITQLKDINKPNIGPTEMRQIEKDTFANSLVLKKCQNNPLFVIGIEEITKTLIGHLGHAMVEDTTFLEAFFNALETQKKLISRQIQAIEGNTTMSNIGTKLGSELGNTGDTLASLLKKNASTLVAYNLRSLAEEYFVSNFYRKEIDIGSMDDGYSTIKVEKHVLIDSLGALWEQTLQSFLDYFMSNESNLTVTLLQLLSAQISDCFAPYAIFPRVEKELKTILTDFSISFVPKFHIAVKEVLRKKKLSINQRPIDIKEKLTYAWPTNSKFIDSCQLDKVSEGHFFRDVLATLVPNIDFITTALVSELMDLRLTFAKHLTNVLATKIERIEEMSEDSKIKLISKKEEFTLGQEYIKSFLIDKGNANQTSGIENSPSKGLKSKLKDGLFGLWSRS